MKLKYNLQYFGEKNGKSNNDTTTNNDDSVANNDSTSDDNGDSGNDGEQKIDPSAFADLISEKDKQIQQLEKDISELKKSNAMLTVRVNAGQKPQEFNTEKAILEFCDTRKLSK